MGNLPEHSVAHSVSVRLLWWQGNCAQRRKPRQEYGTHWATELPKCYEIYFKCIGSTNRQRTTFRVDCVSPVSPMPALHVDEQAEFISVLKDGLETTTGLKIFGLNVDLVDWDGILII